MRKTTVQELIDTLSLYPPDMEVMAKETDREMSYNRDIWHVIQAPKHENMPWADDLTEVVIIA